MIHSSADMPTRGTDSSGHSANNFDFVRFVAASLVLYSHCFALTGYGGDEPLVHWTRGEYAFGGLAVRVFFVISGFLVTTSWLRKPNVIAFAAARCLRIFPALAVALVYCIALGALATTLPLADFLLHPQTIGYFWHNLVLQTEFFLPGGVFHANPNPDAVNGSIWSLYYEVRAYLVVLVLGMLGLTRSRWYGTAAWIAAATVMFVYRPAWGMWVKDDWPVVNAYFCFIGGALVALHPRSLRFLGVPALVAAALVPFCIGTPLSGTAMDVLLVTGTLWVAHRRTPVVARFGRYGDFSYGIFIYAFPTQQLIAWSGLVHGPYAMLALAFPATLALAVFSWHCIERPCRDQKR
jgi:peptidoglycan/LPS O-acetylase OafA/YrhL